MLEKYTKQNYVEYLINELGFTPDLAEKMAIYFKDYLVEEEN